MKNTNAQLDSIDHTGFSLDAPIERKGSGSEKWDMMPENFDICTDNGLPMSVADTDFPAPKTVQKTLNRLTQHGVYGYHGHETRYLDAIVGWMDLRHDWAVDPANIFSTHGLVNGFGLCIDVFTDPGDSVILFTPVYHAFERVISASERTILSSPLIIEDGIYKMDLSGLEARLTGKEKLIAFCSPHNPGGRVWSRKELEALAAFARKHNLLLISDEIHHDLVFEGHYHTPMALIDGISDQLIMMTAATKAFNIAGCHCGNVIISNPGLRKCFANRLVALGISADTFGIEMVTAAYSQESVAWLEGQIEYIDANRKIFDEGMNCIAGVKSMPLQSTYLSWVDFAGTGLDVDDVTHRISSIAKIAANPGRKFGRGGEMYHRFNIGLHKSHILDAVARLHHAFDLS